MGFESPTTSHHACCFKSLVSSSDNSFLSVVSCDVEEVFEGQNHELRVEFTTTGS